ncbi:uncharacterized protein LOC111101347 [Crassostrea virginica]
MKDSIKTQSTYLRYKEEKRLASKDASNTFFPYSQDTSKDNSKAVDSRDNKKVDTESCYSISNVHTTLQKAPHRGKQMRKYMLLFSVILLFVVTSITFALVVTTKNTVDDIPTKVGQQIKRLPALESMEISFHNLSKSQDHLDQA